MAKLAGLPGVVVARAEQVLHSLEQGGQGVASGQKNAGKMGDLADDLPLFSAMQDRLRPSGPDENSPAVKIERELSAILPDELTPRQAMDVLYKLKKLQQDG